MNWGTPEQFVDTKVRREARGNTRCYRQRMARDDDEQRVDAGPVTGPTIDAKCAGKLGLVAGAATDNATYVATYAGAGVFTCAR